MTSGFRRPLIPAAALCALTVAAAGCAPVADQTIGPESQQDNRSVQAAMPVPKPVATERIVIIGDSLSTGYGTSPEEAWPRLLGDDLHSMLVPVEIINAAINGAGYIAVGDEEATFQTQIKGSINASTDVVVFFGSDNDAGQDPAELHAAVMDALQTTKTLAPHAKRVVIGPLPAFDSAASDIDIIRDQERTAALDDGVEFVDPVAEHWIPGPDSALLGPDGEHPSSEGQQFLKGKIKATLGEPRDRPV